MKNTNSRIKVRPTAGLDDVDPARRALVVNALAAGFFAAGLSTSKASRAGWFSWTPDPVPEGKSIFDLSGEVTVNGGDANLDTRIQPGDTVETGGNSSVIFVVGQDSFHLRGNSQLRLEGANGAVDVLRMVTGALLSVFGKSKLDVITPIATIGIRGTGVYVESEPEFSYVCTCYGVSRLRSVHDQESWELVRSLDHDMPRYIVADASPAEAIRGAPLKNHTDAELKLLEALVGRTVPFGFSFDRYPIHPRDY